MIIYPAVDILEGKCVRLHQGSYEAVTVYADDPSDMARRWEEQGAEILHVVDLDGAAEGRPKNLVAVEKIASRVRIPIQLGGGLRSEADLKSAFSAGVDRVVLGSSLVTDPEFVARVCWDHHGKVMAGVDARQGRVAIRGWKEDTSYDVLELAHILKNVGVAGLIHTDILVDGTRRGPNLSSLQQLAEQVDLPIIASGGVATLDDIVDLRALEPLGVEGVIIGSALYEKALSLTEAIKVARD